MFDINIPVKEWFWIGSGLITCLGVIVGTTTKIMTRNHITKQEAEEKYLSSKMCEERSSNVEDKIDDLKDHVDTRFDDLRDVIKNGH